MGSRKKQMADAIKEAKKHVAFAKLNNCPTSPRKMRLVADLVRGEKVENALNILKFNPKEASGRLEKLLLSAIANWQSKNEEANIEEAKLIDVDHSKHMQQVNYNQAKGSYLLQYEPFLMPYQQVSPHAIHALLCA